MLHTILQHYEDAIVDADGQLMDCQADVGVEYIRGIRAGLLYIHSCLDEAADVAAERGNLALVLEDLSHELAKLALLEQQHLEQLAQEAHDEGKLSSVKGYVQALLEGAMKVQSEAETIDFSFS